MEDILKIAVGVFIGALAAAFTWEAVQAVRMEIAAERVRDEVKRADRQMRQEQRARDQAQADAERSQRDLQRRAEEQARAADEARSNALREREAAWKRFYKPPAGCATDPGTTACANDYMRARRLFDVQYQAGTLR